MAEKIVNIEDLRRAARRRLPRMIFDFLEGGALDEQTLRQNRTDLDDVRLRQRILCDVSKIDLGTDVLGGHIALPLMIAPMGLLSLLHPAADIALAQAAARAETIFVHSAWSSCSLEEVVGVAPSSTWAQIAFWTDPGVTADHVDHAQAAGVEVLVIAGDVNVSSKRERDLHHGMAMPPRPRLRDIINTGLKPGWLAHLATGRRPTFGNYPIDGRRMRLREMDTFMHTMENAAATWQDLHELRDRWPGKIVVKGVMSGPDAARAADLGIDAIIVSNHGGRQFDAQPSTIAALPEIIAAADHRLEVYMDGGIRRGSDVVKALATGAQACLIGRPAAYGLAASGAAGADRVLDILRSEISTALGFVGATNTAAANEFILV